MRAQAQAGEISLAYFDEVGFAQVHPNRSSAWTVCGKQYCIEAPHGERLNMMAALFSDGSVIHSRAIQPALRLLEKKGITLKFLPLYSPELNRIEKLWWLMKHRWMALTRRTKIELEHTVNHILTNFGSQFQMAF